MTLVALILLPLLVSSAFAFPIDVALNPGLLDSYDYLNGYYGYGGLSALRTGWPYDFYGSLFGSDLDYTNLFPYASARWPLDYLSSAYPSVVDYAKENFVRGSPFGGAEVGTRNEVTVRPSVLRAPYSRFYSSYFPFNYLRGINRYNPYLGLSVPGTSLLSKIGGDTMYMK